MEVDAHSLGGGKHDVKGVFSILGLRDTGSER